MRGRPHIYCALNRDAARLARHGRDDEARKLAQEADRVEGSEMVRDLVASLERLLSAESLDAGATMVELSSRSLRVMFDHDDSVRSAVIDVVLDIEAVRARASSLDEIQVRLYGKVARILDDVAELDVGEGRVVMVPVDELEELDLSAVGTPVALLWERWGTDAFSSRVRPRSSSRVANRACRPRRRIAPSILSPTERFRFGAGRPTSWRSSCGVVVGCAFRDRSSSSLAVDAGACRFFPSRAFDLPSRRR